MVIARRIARQERDAGAQNPAYKAAPVPAYRIENNLAQANKEKTCTHD